MMAKTSFYLEAFTTIQRNKDGPNKKWGCDTPYPLLRHNPGLQCQFFRLLANIGIHHEIDRFQSTIPLAERFPLMECFLT